MGSLYLCTSHYNGVGGVVSNCHVAVAIEVVGTCVIVGMDSRADTLMGTTASTQRGSSNPPSFIFYLVFVLL